MGEKKHTVAEVLGWYGTMAIIVAYFLVSFNLIASDGLVFQILNLTGALGLIYIAIVKKVRPNVALNAFWMLIAIGALARIAYSHFG